jgi:hypothetical protein
MKIMNCIIMKIMKIIGQKFRFIIFQVHYEN